MFTGDGFFTCMDLTFDIRTFSCAKHIHNSLGIYISFADIELLNDQQRSQAAAIRDDLDGRGDRFVLLNHPDRSLRRYALLKLMQAQGINKF